MKVVLVVVQHEWTKHSHASRYDDESLGDSIKISLSSRDKDRKEPKGLVASAMAIVHHYCFRCTFSVARSQQTTTWTGNEEDLTGVRALMSNIRGLIQFGMCDPFFSVHEDMLMPENDLDYM